MSKYSVKGFPMALHLWFLAYVPKVEATYARLDNSDGFLCEMYSRTELPNFTKIVEIENSGNVEVACVLRSGVNDLPALVDEYNDGLDSLMVLVCRGYRLTRSDWDSKLACPDLKTRGGIENSEGSGLKTRGKRPR